MLESGRLVSDTVDSKNIVYGDAKAICAGVVVCSLTWGVEEGWMWPCGSQTSLGARPSKNQGLVNGSGWKCNC